MKTWIRKTEIIEWPVERCGFSHPGTYGHECGAPATMVAVIKTEAEFGTTGNRYVNQTFYAGRCPKCADIKGGENRGARIEPLNGHINRLECSRGGEWVEVTA